MSENIIAFSTKDEWANYVAQVNRAMGWPNKFVKTWQDTPLENKETGMFGAYHSDRIKDVIQPPAGKEVITISKARDDGWYEDLNFYKPRPVKKEATTEVVENTQFKIVENNRFKIWLIAAAVGAAAALSGTLAYWLSN